MSSAQGLGVSWLCPCFCVLGVPPGCGAPMEYLASLIPFKQKQLPGDATEPPHSRPRAVSKGRSIARRTAPRMQGLGACSFVRWPPRSVTPCPAPMLSEQKVCWPGLLCECFREREGEQQRTIHGIAACRRIRYLADLPSARNWVPARCTTCIEQRKHTCTRRMGMQRVGVEISRFGVFSFVDIVMFRVGWVIYCWACDMRTLRGFGLRDCCLECMEEPRWSV